MEELWEQNKISQEGGVIHLFFFPSGVLVTGRRINRDAARYHMVLEHQSEACIPQHTCCVMQPYVWGGGFRNKYKSGWCPMYRYQVAVFPGGTRYLVPLHAWFQYKAYQLQGTRYLVPSFRAELMVGYPGTRYQVPPSYPKPKLSKTVLFLPSSSYHGTWYLLHTGRNLCLCIVYMRYNTGGYHT